MKKMMMMALMALVAVVAQAADDKVTLTSGDGKWLKDGGKTATVEMDYSDTTTEGKPLNVYLASRGDNFIADWPKMVEAGRASFIEQFNKRNKKGLQVVESGDADYQIKVIVEKLDFGKSGVAVVFGGLGSAGGAEITGKLIVTDKSGEKVAEYELYEVRSRGSYDYTEAKRLCSCYEQIIKMTLKESK